MSQQSQPEPSNQSSERKALLIEKIKLKQRQLVLRENLPHLHGWKWYPWAREFFESQNRKCLLVAANQVSKSSTQIRKMIHWATEDALWPELWDHKPSQFWYFYPTSAQVEIEFEEKWKLFLPRGEFKDSPKYGWKVERRSGELFACHFNSGVSIYFKTYSKKAAALQSSTVDYVACFVAGTKVATLDGDRSVEDIIVGDKVLSKDGWKTVERTGKRDAEIYDVFFSDGKHLSGSPDHPIWTETRGWVPLGQLLCSDICVTVPSWVRRITSRLYCSTGIYTEDTQTAQTKEKATTTGTDQQRCFIQLFGKRTISRISKTVMLSIIGMVLRLTIGLRISNCLPEKTTQDTIKWKSGELKKNTHASAIIVGKTLLRGALNYLFQDTAQQNATSTCHTEKRLIASYVGKLLLFARIVNRCTVLRVVQTKEIAPVYNLTVENSKTYFANGILTHNCDEEMPVPILDELVFRLVSSNGFFSMVFTATLGQEFWRLAMDPGPAEKETWIGAHKQQISMYDCLHYDDFTPSFWTAERIKEIENTCKDEHEIARRVHGKFVLSKEGLIYEAFNSKQHVKEKHPLPQSWNVFSGVDIGSGGTKNHPAAISFIGVNPEYTKARLFLAWRGDGVTTTAGDVLEKYKEMKYKYKLKPVLEIYDWESVDFGIMAARAGEPFVKAEKSHLIGESVLNTLFKKNMLEIYHDEETAKFVVEILNLRKGVNKRSCKDDLIDTVRYIVTKIPWDWGAVTRDEAALIISDKQLSAAERESLDRRGLLDTEDAENRRMQEELSQEFDELNDLYG